MLVDEDKIRFSLSGRILCNFCKNVWEPDDEDESPEP